MNIAVITLAGVSSRFNENQEKKVLKGIYTAGNPRKTILYSILEKCIGFQRVILVGGYQYESLQEYVYTYQRDFSFEIEMVWNPFYELYGSGYSLRKGLEQCFIGGNFSGIVFIEGDLFFEKESFELVKKSGLSCITYNRQPIDSKKAVVAYINEKEQIKYVFNTEHGLLKIEEPFSMLINSGQVWKFADLERVRLLMQEMKEEDWQGTNLVFVEKYFAGIPKESREILALEEWENCNTRDEYFRNFEKL